MDNGWKYDEGIILCPICNKILAKNIVGITSHIRIKHKEIIPEERRSIVKKFMSFRRFKQIERIENRNNMII